MGLEPRNIRLQVADPTMAGFPATLLTDSRASTLDSLSRVGLSVQSMAQKKSWYQELRAVIQLGVACPFLGIGLPKTLLQRKVL
jgi:hypothetical protein